LTDIRSRFNRWPRAYAGAARTVYEKAGIISLAKSSAMSGMMKLRKK
jgi:hypothetical protein